MHLRNGKTQHIFFRAGYGWEWQSDNNLDEIHEFDTWESAQHWLRMKIEQSTLRKYQEPHMRKNAEFRWTSPIGQDFLIWRYVR